MPQTLQYPRLLFRESQKFRQPSIWLIAAAIAMVPVIILVPVLLQKPAGRGYIVMAILFAAGLFPLILTFSGMRTLVTSDILVLDFFPFRKRRIPISQIASFNVETYHPWREFGGWGVKWSMRDSTTAYTVSGDRGVRLQLSTGEKLLIGSQRADELASTLKAATESV